MRVLITGAGGQLARELVRTAPRAVELTALSRAELDITARDQLEERVAELAPDIVINAAAYTHVDRAETEAGAAFAANAAGPRRLARLASRFRFRLVHLSTDYVFSGMSNCPYRRHDCAEPVNVYGASKRQGEIAVLDAAPAQSIVVRTAWLYSRYGNNFVSTMLDRMQRCDRLRVVDDQIGSPTAAATVAKAVWRAARRQSLVGIHHVADGGETSWYEFAVAIAAEALSAGLLTRRPTLQPIPTAASPAAARRPAYSVLDCADTYRALALRPIHWRANLRRLLETLRDA